MAKKYYWLQLKEDFFRQKEIKMLRKIAGGDTYTIIYQKMLLMSLKDNGKIFYEGIGNSFAEEVALEIDEEIENVQVTINYLMTKNLMKSDTEDEMFMNDVPNLIGSESDSAKRVRRHRQIKKEEQKALQCNADVTTSNTEIDIELKKELEKELNKKNASKKNSSTELKERFESIWKLYPRKEGKSVAFKHYQQALKEDETLTDEAIVKGLENYVAYLKQEKTEKTYMKMGETWFSKRSWQDEYAIKNTTPADDRYDLKHLVGREINERNTEHAAAAFDENEYDNFI